MKREDTIKRMLSQVFHGFQQELAGYRIVLFGSRAAGTHQPRSDFDIGVIGQRPLPLRVFYKIEDSLDDIDTLYQLEWVDLARVSARFRDQALRHTEALYEG